MNIYTLLGAALVDEEFSEALFRNPVKAARTLGIALTNQERDDLNDILNTDDVKPHLMAFHGKICPRTPCPYAIAEVCDDPVGTIAAD